MYSFPLLRILLAMPDKERKEGYEIREVIQRTASNFLNSLANPQTPLAVALPTAFALGSLSTVVGTSVYRRYFRRIKNAEWITPDVFQKRKWVKGYVTK